MQENERMDLMRDNKKKITLSSSSSVRIGWPRVLRLFQINVYCIRFTRRYVTTIKRVMELFARSPSRIFFVRSAAAATTLFVYFVCQRICSRRTHTHTRTEPRSGVGVRECLYRQCVSACVATKTKTTYTKSNTQFDRLCGRTLVTQWTESGDGMVVSRLGVHE